MDETTMDIEQKDDDNGTTENKIHRKRQAQSQSIESAMQPITADGDKPQKKFYRQRAHCNPLSHNTSFDYPRSPLQIDWRQDHYPNLVTDNTSSNDNDNDNDNDHISTVPFSPTVLDIGCGFGGLTVALSTLLPNERILGMEIRAKVTEYVRLRILSLRKENASDANADSNADSNTIVGMYENASVLRTNSMKYLPNYFGEASISKLFFCFPDPHFKKKNWPRRIVSERLLTEYAYVLKPGIGILYTITDVKELHDWHVEKCNAHPMFEQLTVHNGDPDTVKADEIDDPCIHAMYTETEEGKKVARNGGKKYFAVYRRIKDNDKDATVTHPWTVENYFESIQESGEEGGE